MSYLFIWGIYFISSFKELMMKTIRSKMFISILFSISMLFTGVRYYMGTDYHNYYILFDSLTDPNLIKHYEIGFLYLIFFLKKLGLGPYAIFFCISLISFYFIKKGIKKNSKSVALSLLIYFSIFMIPFNFNAVGQGLVVALFIYSIDMMKKEETRKLLIIILIATLIHTSGLIILVGYIVYRMKFTIRGLLFISVFSTMVLFINRVLGDAIAKFLPDFISVRFLSYYLITSIPVDLFSVLQRIGILSIIFIFAYECIDDENRRLLQIYVLGFVLYSLFAGNRLFATRINLGFRVLEVLLLPNIIFLMREKANKLFLFLVISFLSIVVLISNFSNPNIFPYRHLWSF